MRRIIGVLAAGAAVVLGLSGCAGAPEASPSTTPQQEQDAAADATPKITASPAAEPASGEEALLKEVRGFRAVPILDSATDEQIISAAKDACEQLSAGTRLIDVDILEGDDPAQEGVLLAETAHTFLCPDAPLDLSLNP